MKRWLAMLAAAAMLSISCAAAADTLDILKPIWLHALEDMQKTGDTVHTDGSDVAVMVQDERLQVEHSGVFMEDEYGAEAYVYARVRNTSGVTIRLSGAKLRILDRNGKAIGEEEYIGFKPDVVAPGGAFYIREWMYDFIGNIDRIGGFELVIEPSEYSRKTIRESGEAKVYMDGKNLYLEWTNTEDEPVYNLVTAGMLTDASGRILDIVTGETYSQMAVAPGSTVIFRKMLEMHVTEEMLQGAMYDAAGYRIEE